MTAPSINYKPLEYLNDFLIPPNPPSSGSSFSSAPLPRSNGIYFLDHCGCGHRARDFGLLQPLFSIHEDITFPNCCGLLGRSFSGPVQSSILLELE
jgi:hypothetical protein